MKNLAKNGKKRHKRLQKNKKKLPKKGEFGTKIITKEYRKSDKKQGRG